MADIQAMTADDKVQTVLQRFGGALAQGDVAAAVACFEPDGFWRDLVSFTWNIATQEGAGVSGQQELRQIAAALHRIEDGTYGTCTKCGADIGEARPDVLP